MDRIPNKFINLFKNKRKENAVAIINNKKVEILFILNQSLEPLIKKTYLFFESTNFVEFQYFSSKHLDQSLTLFDVLQAQIRLLVLLQTLSSSPFNR